MVLEFYIHSYQKSCFESNWRFHQQILYFEGYLTPICQIYKFGLLIKFINLTLIVNSHKTIK